MAAGVPISGVTIAVKGNTLVVQSDKEGNFSLDVADNAVLVLTHVAYKLQEVEVNGQSALQITMEEAVNNMNGVVVVGYQARRRSDLTGAFLLSMLRAFLNCRLAASTRPCRVKRREYGLRKLPVSRVKR
jgi:hypothetical protein